MAAEVLRSRMCSSNKQGWLPTSPMRVSLVSMSQHESLVDLLCELYDYYNQGAAVSRAVVGGHLLENLLAADSPLRLVVAVRSDGAVVGFAAVALLYSLVEPTPEKCRQCLMKELFVSSSQRNQGVGSALMAWVAQFAIENGCCRVEWPVNAANQNGISFYERLGAERVQDRLSYRLSGGNLGKLGQIDGCKP